jgi:hypothetical protein
MLKCDNLIEIRFYAYIYASSFLVLLQTVSIVQIDIVWYIFETRFETKIFPSWTKATLLRIYFRNLSVHRGPTLTVSYYWTCKNQHIATKYVIKLFIIKQTVSIVIVQIDIVYDIHYICIYRLIHGHFHIGLVIIQRPPYWPETESRADKLPVIIVVHSISRLIVILYYIQVYHYTCDQRSNEA